MAGLLGPRGASAARGPVTPHGGGAQQRLDPRDRLPDRLHGEARRRPERRRLHDRPLERARPAGLGSDRDPLGLRRHGDPGTAGLGK